ncbi:proline-rich protein 36-like [Amphibalanus amphitrite]|uniref:proline-rich protein 36-like n=1 Tax=Amphibalanus amphitrite TaxID=1232801 RepID=UPI001C910E5A|nr:proline-rich protein 36-like [Amphibalanus amphitrite]
MASVDTTASPAVAPPPALADVPFIDALSESAANESDGGDPAGTGAAPPPADAERCESRDSPDRDQGTPAARPPLKSALRKGAARRRLQVVINESRNTYCEAAVEREEAGPAPLLVRALSLHLPEVLTCQTAGADAFDRIVAEGGEQLQETPVDDSEGSECSMETLEELAGPAPLARLDDDITLETPAEPPAEEPEVSNVTPSSGDTAEPVDPQPSEQSVSVDPQDGAAGKETQECTQKAANDIANDNSESAESELVCDLKERSPSPVDMRPEQQEPAANECSDARSPSPEACSAQPPRAPDWRNLPDLVSDGARAAAADQPPSPPAGSVLTIANVQQHDRVMEIADSRAHGVLGGILKGGRLWAGGRGAESDDSGDSQPRRGRGRSVRFEGRAPPEPAPRHLPPPPPPLPPAPESDGESSLSSLETVVARSGARPSPQLETELTGEQRALAQLTLGSPLGRTSADVARAIEQNSLRRSLVHASEKRSGEVAGGAADVAANPHTGASVAPPGRQSFDGDLDKTPLSVKGCGRQSFFRDSLFPSLDIEVPRDVREWKISETLFPPPTPPPVISPQSVTESVPEPSPLPVPVPGPQSAPVPVSAPSSHPVPVSAPPPVPASASAPFLTSVPASVPHAAPVSIPSPSWAPAVPSVPPLSPSSVAPPSAAPAPVPAPRALEIEPERQRPVHGLSSAPSSQQPGGAAAAPRQQQSGAVSSRTRQSPRQPGRSPGAVADARILHAAQQLFRESAQQEGQPSQPQAAHTHQLQHSFQQARHTFQQASNQPPPQTYHQIPQQTPQRTIQHRFQETYGQISPHSFQQTPQTYQETPQHVLQRTYENTPPHNYRHTSQETYRHTYQQSHQQTSEQYLQAAHPGLPPVRGPAAARPTVAAPPSRWSTPEMVGWDRVSPQTAAGARHSAASSADSKDSLGSQRSRDSRSSYSLDDIDDVLSEPTPAVPPAAGSGDSGYGSTDGRAGAETDELAAFAERESARTERLRRRYVSPGGEPGARQPAVRRVRSGSERTGWTPVADAFGQLAPRGTRPAVETMSHGYVYPEYVPARVPPLPPRQGQVRPAPTGWPSVGQRADWGGGPPWAEQHGQWLPGRAHSGHLVHPGLGAGPRDDRLRRSAHY